MVLEISHLSRQSIINSQDNEMLVTNLHTDEYYDEFLVEGNRKLSFVDSSLLHLHKSKYFKVITLDKNLKERLGKSKKK